jgi:hypothetical protein
MTIATKALLFDEMSTRFPMHCLVLESICISNALFGSRINLHDRTQSCQQPTSPSEKENTVLFHFLTLCHQQNKDYLCHWFMTETLAYEAKGFQATATSLVVEHWYATSPNHPFGVLNEYSNQGASTLASVIASEVTLNAGIDNYNRSRNKTFQAGNKSALMHKGTVMYRQCNMLPCLSFVSQL